MVSDMSLRATVTDDERQRHCSFVLLRAIRARVDLTYRTRVPLHEPRYTNRGCVQRIVFDAGKRLVRRSLILSRRTFVARTLRSSL